QVPDPTEPGEDPVARGSDAAARPLGVGAGVPVAETRECLGGLLDGLGIDLLDDLGNLVIEFPATIIVAVVVAVVPRARHAQDRGRNESQRERDRSNRELHRTDLREKGNSVEDDRTNRASRGRRRRGSGGLLLPRAPRVKRRQWGVRETVRDGTPAIGQRRGGP